MTLQQARGMYIVFRTADRTRPSVRPWLQTGQTHTQIRGYRNTTNITFIHRPINLYAYKNIYSHEDINVRIQEYTNARGRPRVNIHTHAHTKKKYTHLYKHVTHILTLILVDVWIIREYPCL
jgi:hypothetical protein